MTAVRVCIAVAVSWCACAGAAAVEYTSYLGDSSIYHVARLRVDPAGNTFVAGNRHSGSLSEMFVAKLDSNGSRIWFAVLGGSGVDTVTDLALDAAGNLYLAGATNSVDFPVHNAMQSTPGPGFVVKLSPDAAGFVFSTYFPGAVSALAIDPAGAVYVTGTTNSPAFPVTAGMPASHAGGGVPMIFAAFVSKISADGARLVYSGTIAGTDKPCGCCSSCFLSQRDTVGTAIAVDAAGDAYIAGNTDTTNVGVTAGAFLKDGIGAFVAKVKNDGAGLSYLTYISSANYVLSPGNTPGTSAAALSVDAGGSVYLTGSTSDPGFPATPSAYQTKFAGPVTSDPYPPPPSDAYVLKLKPDGSGLVWATYFGAPGPDSATEFSVDGAGRVWIGGSTASGDFLAGFQPDASKLIFNAAYPSGTISQSLVVDASGMLHTAGATGAVFAIQPGAAPRTRIYGVANAAWGLAGAQFASPEVISIYGVQLGPSDGSTGAIRVTLGNTELPLLYVSPAQVNAIVPRFFSATSLQLTYNGATASLPILRLNADPQVFQNPDGSLNSADHPAAAGSPFAIWLTGTGDLPDCCAVLSNSGPVAVLYAGPAPGLPDGVTQINFVAPPGPPYVTGPAPVGITVSVGGAQSHPVTLWVQ